MNLNFTTEPIVYCFPILLSQSVIENKNDEFPATLKLKANFTFLKLLCPTYKHDLRHIPEDTNYKTFSKVST